MCSCTWQMSSLPSLAALMYLRLGIPLQRSVLKSTYSFQPRQTPRLLKRALEGSSLKKHFSRLIYWGLINVWFDTSLAILTKVIEWKVLLDISNNSYLFAINPENLEDSFSGTVTFRFIFSPINFLTNTCSLDCMDKPWIGHPFSHIRVWKAPRNLYSEPNLKGAYNTTRCVQLTVISLEVCTKQP